MSDLEGKVCLVTGGAMGLGRADAELLAGAGAQIVITDIDEAQGRRTAEELGSYVTFLRHDVTREAEWEQVIAEIIRRFGRLDVLVNNAGIVLTTDIENGTEADWRKVNAVSADGTFFGCKHAIRAMRAHPPEAGYVRSIVNMSSVAALRGFPGIIAYSAAKGAIRAMTSSIALHCREQNLAIRCNALFPGNMDTPMVRNFMGEAADTVQTMGSAYDVANAVLFLASEKSRYLNGAEIVIDNGTILPVTL